MSGNTKVTWPDGKRFAFTIFDDPDSQTLRDGREVYALLRDLGFRTTKGVWTIWGGQPRSDPGGSCADPDYRDWALELHRDGFEMGWHNATQYTSDRAETERGLATFEALFGASPVTMSNHYNCQESLYWGENRLSGPRRLAYNVLTRGANRNRSFGHVDGHPYFWGDHCARKVRYVRNFVYGEIDTLRACPVMPYHDPDRPYARYWYASSEGANVNSFTSMLREENQERLAEGGGASIMYTHFGHGYVRDGQLDPRFRRLMTRLADAGGWFVPVGTLLDHLRANGAGAPITPAERARLEWRWLTHKVRYGTA